MSPCTRALPAADPPCELLRGVGERRTTDPQLSGESPCPHLLFALLLAARGKACSHFQGGFCPPSLLASSRL